MIAALTQRLATWEAFLGVMALGLLGYAVIAVPNFTSAFNLSQAAAGVSEKALLVLPIVCALTRQVVEDADHAHGEQLRSLGAGTLLRSVLLAWDERYALLTVLLASFGRAISEVGAVMIVGGNIDGFTRVMTTAIALEIRGGTCPWPWRWA